MKNPGMRYRNGGAFADAVAAVRSGRRPPRPNHAPTIGRAAPAAIPSGARPVRRPRCAPPPPRGPDRPTGSHRPPPARRTFSSGQRALLWAAGVLGALAIVIAVLIVLNARNDSKNQQSPPTVTDTVTPSPGAPAPAEPTDWTEQIRQPRTATDDLRFLGTGSCRPHKMRCRHDQSPPQYLSDRYELGEILGFGGMSEVHKARDTACTATWR